MVVSDSEVASLIGRDMLTQGGTAVDAAVATAFALAVSWPDAGNIGGGGFMIVRPADGKEPVCIDYRETAPLTMNARSFSKQDTTYTQKAVGVPGTVRGLAAAHARYGKLPWKEVVMPAAKLAAEGVPVTEPLAESLNAVLTRKEVQSDEKYAELRRVYGKAGGGPWQAGDQLVLPDLSQTLTEIADRGPDAFYTGRVAKLMVEEMQRGDGLISLEDLRSYSAKIRPALQGSYRGYTIIGAPPPASGGTCVIEALNILENYELSGRDRYDPLNVHLIAEALRRAFADRAKHLGDPDFVEIPAASDQQSLRHEAGGRDRSSACDEKRGIGSGNRANRGEPRHDSLFGHRWRRHGRQQHVHVGGELGITNRCSRRRFRVEQRDGRLQLVSGRDESRGSHRNGGESHRTGKTDAQFTVTHDRRKRWPRRADHWQPRRTDDHQHRAVRHPEYVGLWHEPV